ncbi:MAG: hypothetical protein GY811_15385 [Myxococcales bacterium]|nr:hypothetical protein [Myxococcales bacterium]
MAETLRPTLLANTSSPLLSGVLVAGLSLTAFAACSSDDLSGAKAEVMETSIKLDLPPVPDFVVPKPNPDGSHSIAELRLNGKSFLDTEISAKGTILWIYDCATAIRSPEMTDKDLKKILETEPERCTRPHFIIGEDASTKTERGIQVVEYPRAIRKDKKSALPDERIAEMEAALAALPEFKVGDEVRITGQWTLDSPKGFHNSDGLMVYGGMENMTTPAVPAE